VAHDAEEDERGDGEIVGRWYASTFDVGHTAFEFKVDCGQVRKNDLMTVFFRVIASPRNARELFRQLGVSLVRYTDTFGPIDDNERESRSGR
jgi:hypothetical protein